jgi:hypothetical protein
MTKFLVGRPTTGEQIARQYTATKEKRHNLQPQSGGIV